MWKLNNKVKCSIKIKAKLNLDNQPLHLRAILRFDLQYFETPRSITTLEMGKTFPIYLGVL